MQNPKTGGNRFNPDIRPSEIDTYTETNGEQTAEYKIINAHPIINGILNKLTFFRTHAAAVYYNRLANKTVKQKFDDVDAAVGELNEKLVNNLGKVPELAIDFDDAPLLNILTANNQSINKPPRLSSNAFLVLQLLPHNKNYSAQVVFGFGNREIAMRTRASGSSTTWSDWDYFVPKSYVDDKFLIVDKTLSLPEGITTRGAVETSKGFIDTKGKRLIGYVLKSARTALEIHIQTLTVDSSGKCTLVYDKQSEQAFNIEITFTFM